MIDDTIREEKEHENDHDYLSDSSNASSFSMRRRYLNLDLSKLIDKLEPLDESSAVASKYYGFGNETIEEEHSDHSDEFEDSRISHNSSSSHQKESRLYRGDLPFFTTLFPLGLGSRKMPKARSLIC